VKKIAIPALADARLSILQGNRSTLSKIWKGRGRPFGRISRGILNRKMMIWPRRPGWIFILRKRCGI